MFAFIGHVLLTSFGKCYTIDSLYGAYDYIAIVLKHPESNRLLLVTFRKGKCILERMFREQDDRRSRLWEMSF